MEILGLVKLGTPVLVLGMLVFLERINEKVNGIREDVQEIKQGMTWNDTCSVKHEEVDRRLGNVERATGLNGRQERPARVV
jgi:hypothetical protein